MMKFAVRCRSPGNLAKMHWHASQKFAALQYPPESASGAIGHGPVGPVCVQHVCECSDVGGRGWVFMDVTTEVPTICYSP